MPSYSKDPLFGSTSPYSDIELVAGRMVALAPNNQIFACGSCVRIAPNLYLTARHVMTDFIDKFGHSNGGVNFTVWIMHTYKGPEYAVWELDEFYLSPHSDLAVLHVSPYNDTAADIKAVRTVGIDLIPPSIGSRISGFGYHSSTGSISVNSSGSLHFEVNGEGAAAIGEVREYHHMGTDRVLRPFPCFRVNARFDGGMSGGPIFSANGKLCGVICTGLPPYDERDEHCSFASALWPLMGTVVGINPNTGCLEDQSFPVIELAKSGFIKVHGLERVSVAQSNVEGMYEVTYRRE